MRVGLRERGGPVRGEPVRRAPHGQDLALALRNPFCAEGLVLSCDSRDPGVPRSSPIVRPGGITSAGSLDLLVPDVK
ncbi:hypothetical protein STXM2123_668 [Streptomyces sp. F-3]|nr:hypothetical protein STXM2123_668 [Streptomyces sp. F-3]